MEPEIPKSEGSQWFTSFVHGLLAFHVQEDGMWHRNWHDITHLRDHDEYEAGGIQLLGTAGPGLSEINERSVVLTGVL